MEVMAGLARSLKGRSLSNLNKAANFKIEFKTNTCIHAHMHDVVMNR